MCRNGNKCLFSSTNYNYLKNLELPILQTFGIDNVNSCYLYHCERSGESTEQIHKDTKRREEGSYRELDVLGRSLKVTLGFSFLFSQPLSDGGAPLVSVGDCAGEGRNFGLSQ